MNSRTDDSFFNVPLETRRTIVGEVKLPIFYYDATCGQAFFRCHRRRVDDALSGTGFTPALASKRYAWVVLAFFNYRATSIGAYNEVGLAVPVIPSILPHSLFRWRELFMDVENPERQLGFYILHLPVTTPVADAAGRELWGYPKFITAIPPPVLSHRRVFAQVWDPASDHLILTLRGRPGPSLPGKTLSLLLYSKLGEQTLRSTVNARGTTQLFTAGSVRLEIGGSQHPMAATLCDLGLDCTRPSLLGLTPNFRSRLNAGIPIRDERSSRMSNEVKTAQGD